MILPAINRLTVANTLYNEGVTEKPFKSSITLRDVAARAGVNATTVSVVLNGNRSGTRVSAATRERILSVASELGYSPNMAARGMKSRRMNSIGVVDIMHAKGLNLYFLEVLNGILEKAAEREQNTTVFTLSNWETEEDKILQFCDGRVDGLIFVGPQFRAEFAQTLFRRTPFVALHSNIPLPVSTTLEIDDEQGGYLATNYLTELGHRRIAHLAGPEHFSGANQRIKGYLRALEEAGIVYDASLVMTGEFDAPSGRERAERILDNGALRPTALFCANDQIAFGAMEVLAERGVPVPSAMSVVGFDDSLTARMTNPPLTTICQPFRQLGQHAVELLLDQIGNNAVNKPVSSEETTVIREIFPVELVVRGSTSARS
ncbi:MAG: LacI family DNA-binding transcriptional regulator [Akkermansiaceae bacterium]|nr:LacI family DNA-binding transcriptional regulator [Armatimonadota bacterium]